MSSGVGGGAEAEDAVVGGAELAGLPVLTLVRLHADAPEAGPAGGAVRVRAGVGAERRLETTAVEADLALGAGLGADAMLRDRPQAAVAPDDGVGFALGRVQQNARPDLVAGSGQAELVLSAGPRLAVDRLGLQALPQEADLSLPTLDLRAGAIARGSKLETATL